MTILSSIKALLNGDRGTGGHDHDHDHDHGHDHSHDTETGDMPLGAAGPGRLMDRGDGELAGLHDHEADQEHPHPLGAPNSTIETDVRPSSAD